MGSSDRELSPRKRLKLSPELKKPTPILSQEAAVLAAKEAEVGITEYTSSHTPAFQGILKKRYTDFLVNEILPNGKVLHLQNLGCSSVNSEYGNAKPAISSKHNRTDGPPISTSAKEPPSIPILETSASGLESSPRPKDEQSAEAIPVGDIAKLMTALNEDTVKKLLALDNKILEAPNAKPRDHGSVTCPVPAEKSVRTSLHQDIRRTFHSRIDSFTDKEKGTMTFSAAAAHRKGPSQAGSHQGNSGSRPGKLGWAERGGEYLHFSLYKENKDTMEVISYLSKQLRMNAKSFQFAGTKDKRAVTVQRVSAYRVEETRLAYQNKMLRNSAVGDFEYQKRGLELGDLSGNEFVITLRECQWEQSHDLPIKEVVQAAEKAVSQACRDLHERGFINYYGLQRFGTFSTRTDAVGIKILQGDFEGACQAILDYHPDALAAAQDSNSTERISSDDKARAEAIHRFETSAKVNEALELLPRKFSAESNVIRHLGRSRKDYAGAIQMIQRNLRLIYVHAYQGLVWNSAVSERWRLYGNQVVEGDLVLVSEHKENETGLPTAAEEVDGDGEVIIHPAGQDRAQAVDDVFQRARALTAGEAACGKYSMFDVVLPLPGYDIIYPNNAMAEFYQNFMGSKRGGGLDPFDMRRKQKDFSLSGSYRKMFARISSGYEVQIRTYRDDNEQFAETDMDVIKEHLEEKNVPMEAASQEPLEGDKLAVVLRMQLGSSQYATMALRELSKSGITAYKPDFGGGR